MFEAKPESQKEKEEQTVHPEWLVSHTLIMASDIC